MRRNERDEEAKTTAIADEDPVVGAAIDGMNAAYKRGDVEAVQMLTEAIYRAAIN